MDFTSFIGFISGITLVICAILLGGDVYNFVNIPGMMIVFGGTIAATLFTFQFRDVATAFKAAYFVFTEDKQDPNHMIETMIKLCNVSRRHGIMKLDEIKTESVFLKKACQLIADSAEQNIIRSSLRTEIESMKMRHFIVQDVFRKMGTYSPALGMIGTLIGLVQMLSKLEDATSIGPAMAVALLTTFYGTILSTMVFLPIAGKLKARTITKAMHLEIIFEGAISILENNNPTLVYEKLSSYIPSRDRKPLKSMRTK